MRVPRSWEVLPARTTQGSGHCLQEDLSTQPRPDLPPWPTFLSASRGAKGSSWRVQRPDSGRLAGILHAVDHIFRQLW